MRSFATRLLHGLVAFYAASQGGALAETFAFNAGISITRLADPVGGGTMQAALFYPADGPVQPQRFGPYLVQAGAGARPAAGPFPVVLLSHGSGGGMFSHHDTATHLARNGYVVAALEHPGDNYRDQRGQGSDLVVAGRVMQLSALLDQLLADAAFSSRLDPTRVGVAGFSAGASSALQMVGARPDFALLPRYCACASASVLCEGGGRIRFSQPPLVARPDPRVRAAFVMGPIGAYFGPEGLAQVGQPVAIFAAGADEVLPHADNAARVRTLLQTVRRYVEVDRAGHFVFLAPCSAELVVAAAAICNDPPGVDRIKVHETLNTGAAAFFGEALATGRAGSGR
ncbi:MAG TPA: hypothetical protein VIM12_14580 [Noviherbaspirillum sp.]|jgi:predicted dienelactone hydrolase|uniref:alpha/beta hydrolase family protein n=1 Tax=Noviherbaspirillum sp. TaxID=1926288 RepID=UPI002F94E641